MLFQKKCFWIELQFQHTILVGGNNKIPNFKNPTQDQDTVNKRYLGYLLDTRTLSVTTEGAQQDSKLNNRVISNAPNPVNPQDLVKTNAM